MIDNRKLREMEAHLKTWFEHGSGKREFDRVDGDLVLKVIASHVEREITVNLSMLAEYVLELSEKG